MKQISFETRQKADELLKEAQAVWNQSDRAEDLEGLGDDPVFSLLITALAYQSNEIDSEIERLKSEVLEDFARLLVPYEMGHAVPATAVVETALQDDVEEIAVGENTRFLLQGGHPFIPLLESRALNATIHSVTRLDGRRWKVSLRFGSPVTDLSQFTFAIKGVDFADVHVSVRNRLLPLVKPWHYSELPLSPLFSPDSMSYNLGQLWNTSLLPMDLFARQNVRLFCVRKHSPETFIPSETDQIDLIFEFTGIPDKFSFDRENLALNAILLVNASVGEVTISAQNPIAHLVGGQSAPPDDDLSSRQFLHLIRPPETQIYGDTPLEIRGVAGDRFNQGSLYKLLNCIVTRYRSDFYAFRQLSSEVAGKAVVQLESAMAQLKSESAQDVLRNVSGVYLMPRGPLHQQKKDFSLNVRYLTTAGAAVNQFLGTPFEAPSGFSPAGTAMIATPAPGMDEVKDEAATGSLLRYFMVTGDRLVTMADIKFFCRKQLMVLYGIEDSLISRLETGRRLDRDDTGFGYEIVVNIVLVGNAFIKRSFTDKLRGTELLLQKMAEARSAGIYPIKVNINIEE